MLENVLDQFNWDTSYALYHIIQLLIAFVLALPVGFHRWRARRNLGFRTIPLVSLASAGFILVGQQVAGTEPGAQARLMQGLMSGIGFLGGGAIVKQGVNVLGATTAASIWTTAAVGAAVAWQFYEVAVCLAVFNLLVLFVLTPAKEKMEDEIETGKEEQPSDEEG